MNQFKVVFFMNHAISAERIELSVNPSSRISFNRDKSLVEWLVVFAVDEIDAVLCADDIYREYLSKQIQIKH